MSESFINPILRGNGLARTVLQHVEDSDPTPPNGTRRPHHPGGICVACEDKS